MADLDHRHLRVSGATGTRDLYLRFAGGSGNLLNLNWWQFNGTTGGGGTVLTNGDVENGTTGWSVHGSGTLSRNTSVAHGGSGSLSITGRTGAWNGPGQDVTSKLTNGKSYTTNVWVRSQSGTPSAKATLSLTANGTTNYLQLTPAVGVNVNGWTLLTGTTTVSWSGTLSNATFYVETAEGTDGLRRRRLVPVRVLPGPSSDGSGSAAVPHRSDRCSARLVTT
ncbi:carbohydrate binding domain-containing protein [Micromonospora sp. M12]